MTANTQQTVLRLEPREDFVLAPDIEQVCRRAMAYLDAGYPCHFRGSAGTGKTTLMKMIEQKLKDNSNPDILVVWFDAWKYEKENS